MNDNEKVEIKLNTRRLEMQIKYYNELILYPEKFSINHWSFGSPSNLPKLPQCAGLPDYSPDVARVIYQALTDFINKRKENLLYGILTDNKLTHVFVVDRNPTGTISAKSGEVNYLKQDTLMRDMAKGTEIPEHILTGKHVKPEDDCSDLVGLDETLVHVKPEGTGEKKFDTMFGYRENPKPKIKIKIDKETAQPPKLSEGNEPVEFEETGKSLPEPHLTPAIDSYWIHHKNGQVYRVKHITNRDALYPYKYPVTVVYRHTTNGGWWSMPLDKFLKTMRWKRLIDQTEDEYEA